MKEAIVEALARFSYGIYILTSHRGEEKHGMIASWASQISHTPPLVMVAVRKNRRMHPIIKDAGSFALHVLDAEDKKVIGKFKLPSPQERFEGIECGQMVTGCPIVKETVARLDCRLKTCLDAGDHTLFIGEVVEADVGEGAPMTSWDYGKVYLGDS